MLSSVTASAIWASLRIDADEDEGRAVWVRGSGLFRRGMAIMANFRTVVDRFTMKTFHENGLPTSTRGGPVNVIDTPRSVVEYALSLKELRLTPVPPAIALLRF